jgi:flagellar hook assembly protein FlgD
VTKVARYVFVALVVATFGAFFVAQRLKNGPTLVQKFHRNPVFSPNQDGRLDRENINFLIKNEDDVTVDVVDTKGDRVKRLADNRRMNAYTALFLKWDGTADDGRPAPDGIYRTRIALRGEGRSVVIQKSFRKDTKPPVVRVTAIGPIKGPGAELFPTRTGKPVTIRFSAPTNKRKITIFRTHPGPVEPVVGPLQIPNDKDTFDWDGTRANGRRVRPGTYLAVVEARNQAQIVGTSVPLRRDRTPRIPFGQRLPGHGGITVRYLGVQPPMAPLPAGRSHEIFVDARGKSVQWSLRRAGGGPRPMRRSGGKVKTPLKVPIPRGNSGLFVLTVRSGARKQQVALPVRSSTPHRVLVVLPAITWAGRNPADDDGDGAINTLDRGVGAAINRVMVGDGTGLPVGLGTQEAKLLAFLDRNHHRYDLTTDWALYKGGPPARLDAYKGVLLAGDTRWLPTRVGARLRRFVRGGGTLASFGTQSLRAQVSVSPHDRLFQPTALDEEDLFGARIGRLVRTAPTTLTSVVDKLQWFAGGTGELAGYTRYEPTLRLGKGLERLSAAVTETEPKTVVVGARFGRGVVLRTGLPELPLRLDDDRNSAELVERTWTLLSQ